MERNIWRCKHVSTNKEEAEVFPLQYNTRICIACNTQPTSSLPYILTAIAKHKACGQSKGKRKRHQDHIKSWHEDISTPQTRWKTKPKLWNLPHCEVHTAAFSSMSLRSEKVENESKVKLLTVQIRAYVLWDTLKISPVTPCQEFWANLRTDRGQ